MMVIMSICNIFYTIMFFYNSVGHFFTAHTDRQTYSAHPAQLNRTLTSGYLSAIFFTAVLSVTSSTSVVIPVGWYNKNYSYTLYTYCAIFCSYQGLI